MNDECPCGRPRAGCEYHDPKLQPKSRDDIPFIIPVDAPIKTFLFPPWYHWGARPDEYFVAGKDAKLKLISVSKTVGGLTVIHAPWKSFRYPDDSQCGADGFHVGDMVRLT